GAVGYRIHTSPHVASLRRKGNTPVKASSRRPQYGNHSTNLPFGNDEHTFYIRLIVKRTVFTVHEEVVKKTTSAPWEK
ncbi:unnamed protein product, partial [Ascophyllum nodosum]